VREEGERKRARAREGEKKIPQFFDVFIFLSSSLLSLSPSMPSPPLSLPPVATTCPPPPPPAARADGEDERASVGTSSLLRDPSLLSPREGSGQAPQLEQLVASTRRCHLTPAAFMVSWQGVLTLAYR